MIRLFVSLLFSLLIINISAQNPTAVPTVNTQSTTQLADPTSADINHVLMVDTLNNIIDFNPSQYPGTLNFLLTLQPGVITQGVKSVSFTATAVNSAAPMTIKINTLDSKPYISGSPIDITLAEIATKNTPTTVAIGITSVDGKTAKTFSFLIPPDGQAGINSAALCLLNQNQCLIMPSNIDSTQSAAPTTAAVNDASMSSSSMSSTPLTTKTLSLGDNSAFIHLLIILASITGFFTMINVVLYYHQSKAAMINTSNGTKATSSN